MKSSAQSLVGWIRLGGVASVLSLACIDPAIAANLEVQIQGSTAKPLAGSVVTLSPVGGGADVPRMQIEIAQKNVQFTPRVSAVSVGSEVSFPNLDPVRHHVYSFSKAKLFELQLYGKNRPDPIVFDKPGTVVLGCNIHDRMVGFVRIVKAQYFGVTDVQGRWQLELPAGRYKVQVWHPDNDLEKAVDQAELLVDEASQSVRYQLPVS